MFENGKAISVEKASMIYKLTAMQYNTILSAIPKIWRDYFKINAISFSPTRPSLYDTMASKDKISSNIYKTLTNELHRLGDKVNKWSQDIKRVLDIDEFSTLCKRINNTTNVPKLRSFQYRIMQRAIVTNKKLYVWKITENDMCSFCGNCQETVLHLMFECQLVVSFWQDVKEFIEQRGQSFKIELEQILLNTQPGPAGNLANFLCLLGKHYIYVQRCQKKPLNKMSFQSYVNTTEVTEKYIAKKNGNLSKHLTKWGKLSLDP